MRKILSAVLLASSLVAIPSAQAESRFEKRAREKQAIAQSVVWPTHEPIMFSLRRGKHGEDLVETYARQHAPDNIKQMLAAGVKYGRLHFYKGFGVDYERPEIEKSIEMADFMHKNGMKVSIYVAGTMFVESFYREKPEARDWEQQDQVNRPVYYSDTQTYRHFACPNEPAYREYIKKVLDIGIEKIKADQIFFDNVFLQPEPKSCRCDRCQRAFRAFLTARYPNKEAFFRRFGYPNASYIYLNDWDVFNRPEDVSEVDDPVLQEWERFRAETVAKYCADYYDYIKGKNPNISVGFNLKGLYGLNRIWRNGVYQPFFKGKIDFSPFDVGGMDAHIDPRTGAVISEIRSYKMARTLGFAYETGGDSLEFATFMAFNPQKHIPGYGYQGSPNHSRGEERCFSPEAELFREYSDRYYNETKNVADVAVVRTWASMAYSMVSTLVPTILTEQTLIQHKVPFDIIFDGEMDSISKYKAVVLPGQESLSSQWVDALKSYVQAGGTVVFTDNTAAFNDWRETRKVNPLLKFMGVTRPLTTMVKTVGKGKMVYIPEVTPATGGRAATRQIGIAGDETSLTIPSVVRGGSFAASDWVLPKNHEAIYHAIVDNMREPLSVTTEAPLTTLMELDLREKSSEAMLHFVNYERNHATAPFPVKLRNQLNGRKVASVQALTPESDNPQTLQFTQDSNGVSFTVPAMKVYSMVVVSYK